MKFLSKNLLEGKKLISYVKLHTVRTVYVTTGSLMWLHKQRTANLTCAGVPDVAKCCHGGRSWWDTNAGNTSPKTQVIIHLFFVNSAQNSNKIYNWVSRPFLHI